MNQRQHAALLNLRTLTAGTFDAWRLAGGHNAKIRAYLMEQITGQKTPQAKAGVNALNAAFRNLAPITGECEAELTENFQTWATAQLAGDLQTLGAPKHTDPEAWKHSTTIADNYTANVNLKWSLWSVNKGYWEEYAPGVWEWMREWYDANTDPGNPEAAELSDAPRVVNTAPKKEIRQGVVTIYPGRMTVDFWGEDDNGGSDHFTADIEAETFAEAMHQVDHIELGLIRDFEQQTDINCTAQNCTY
jgi:hypothetical protein